MTPVLRASDLAQRRGRRGGEAVGVGGGLDVVVVDAVVVDDLGGGVGGLAAGEVGAVLLLLEAGHVDLLKKESE